jgi:tetratricopeptide (TPR) repeat protein
LFLSLFAPDRDWPGAGELGSLGGTARIVTENDYITELKTRWPRDREASLELIALADEAVRIFSQSPQLWCMRGCLIQLGPEGNPHSLDDALASFKHAIELDPQFAEAWEEIGYFYDYVLDDEASAQPYFREAVRLKGHHAA